MAAQALAVSAANAQESLTCVKCLVQLVCARAARLVATRACLALTMHRLHWLVRQAVHQIAGLRGLFPDDAFNRRELAGLPNVMELKVRDAALRLATVALISAHTQADFSAETRQVCDWIDRGAA